MMILTLNFNVSNESQRALNSNFPRPQFFKSNLNPKSVISIMISIDEAHTLKFFFMGLTQLQLVNIPKPVIDSMKELVIFHIAYERISITTDVLMELIDFVARLNYEQVNLTSSSKLIRLTCEALDLAPIFLGTQFSLLKAKTNYLLKEEHIEYYFELLKSLNNTVKEHYSYIDISKYIGKQWINKQV